MADVDGHDPGPIDRFQVCTDKLIALTTLVGSVTSFGGRVNEDNLAFRESPKRLSFGLDETCKSDF